MRIYSILPWARVCAGHNDRNPPWNALSLQGAAEEVVVLRVCLYSLADDELDFESSFVFLFREADDAASHACLSSRKCLQVIGGEGGREGRDYQKRDGFDCSHCVRSE